jgi:hypothetical protein
MILVGGLFEVLPSVLAGDLKRRLAEKIGRRYMDRIGRPSEVRLKTVLGLVLHPGLSVTIETAYSAPVGTAIGIRIRPLVRSAE